MGNPFGNSPKIRRYNKNKKNHKGEIQFKRTVRKTGKWRGKLIKNDILD